MPSRSDEPEDFGIVSEVDRHEAVADELGPASGHCDGFRGTDIRGWAWHSQRPDVPVTIELVIAGKVVATALADQFRADLRKAGIGDGNHAWSLPFSKSDLAQEPPSEIIVRASSGEAMIGGTFMYPPTPSEEDHRNPAFAGFISQVLGLPGDESPAWKDDAAPSRPVNLLIVAPWVSTETSLGESEYSYGFAAKAYRRLFETLATVHDVDGSADAVDRLHAECIGRGEGSIVLSFFPPHRTTLTMCAPVVPVIAWEYPTIPDGGWSGQLSDDWRFVLRQAGRAIVASHHSAAAIRAVLGKAFPVAVIPHPVFDRTEEAELPPSPGKVVQISLDGFVFDTRIDQIAWLADRDSGETGRSTMALEGVVFTSVFAPKDGRKAWQDSITAFIDAHRHHDDACLVLKMISRDPDDWRWELHELLVRERPFRCRIVALHGYLEDAGYARLIAASHWIVSATLAEGQCLPLLEFMSAGRPAITAAHTAMADYATPDNSLLIAYGEESCAWPQDPTNRFRSSRARLDWETLREAFETGRRMVLEDWSTYVAMGREARQTMRAYCSDAVVAERLDSFLGLNVGRAIRQPVPASAAGNPQSAIA
jgi:glycosyltransferase involved in cell wall biosynthesis